MGGGAALFSNFSCKTQIISHKCPRLYVGYAHISIQTTKISWYTNIDSHEYSITFPGLLVGREKKVKYRRIFRAKFAEKTTDFAGIFDARFAEKIGTLRYTTASCYYGYFGREGLG